MVRSNPSSNEYLKGFCNRWCNQGKMNGDVERGGIIFLLPSHLASSKWSKDSTWSRRQTASCEVLEPSWSVEILFNKLFFSPSVMWRLAWHGLVIWGPSLRDNMIRKLNQVACGRPLMSVSRPKDLAREDFESAATSWDYTKSPISKREASGRRPHSSLVSIQATEKTGWISD